MTINEFLQEYRKESNGLLVVRPRVRCADGYTVSVQANEYCYCSPRSDADHYDKVELGDIVESNSYLFTGLSKEAFAQPFKIIEHEDLILCIKE